MSRFDYEKNNAVVTLKNEKFGIEQILSDLNKLKNHDFSKIEGKIINVKIENDLKSCVSGHLSLCIGYDNVNKFSLIVENRYNSETKGYIEFYDSYKVVLGYNKVLKDGISEQRRFDTFKMLEIINNDIEALKAQLERIDSDLKNIDSIIVEMQEIYEKVREFKKDKTNFLLNHFRDLNGFY